GGTYYLLATNNAQAGEVGGVATGSYRVSVASVGADDHGDRLQDATSLPLGTRIDGQFDLPYDRDVFRVSLQGGQRYQLTLSNTGSTSLEFSGIQLLDAAGQELLLGARVQNQHDSVLSFVAPATATYYMVAANNVGYSLAPSASTGAYAIRAQRENPLAAGFAPGHADHAAGPHHPGRLNRYLADRAAGSEDQHGLAILELPAPVGRKPGRHSGGPEGNRLFGFDPRGKRDAAAFGDHCPFSHRTPGKMRPFEPDDLPVRHAADPFEAGCVRKRRGAGVKLSGGDREVDRVDPGDQDLDDLRRSGHRVTVGTGFAGGFGFDQFRGFAVSGYLGSFHAAKATGSRTPRRKSPV
ncbi:MAG TPA: hypothetical protein PLE13_11095, partial [Solirubrobacterales bacterium]|nr:hypothetical protein [Solirubrobacterales bacterium]